MEQPVNFCYLSVVVKEKHLLTGAAYQMPGRLNFLKKELPSGVATVVEII